MIANLMKQGLQAKLKSPKSFAVIKKLQKQISKKNY